MSPRARLTAEAVIMVLLVAAIVMAATTRGDLPTLDGNWLWGTAGGALLLGLGYAALLNHRRRLRFLYNVDLLKAALWEVVRGMENYPTHSAGKRARDRTELVARFTDKAAEAGAGRGGMMGMGMAPMPTPGPDLTSVGLEVVERNEKDSSGHWRRVNGIRRGADVLFALFHFGNPTIAFHRLIDHMKIQARSEKGSMPNHTELKRLFGLPLAWPEEGMAEHCEAAGVSVQREIDIMEAVTGGRAAVFAGVEYRPWPRGNDDPDIFYRGEEILEEIRKYIR